MDLLRAGLLEELDIALDLTGSRHEKGGNEVNEVERP
jgi:hypothetical protein